MSIDILARLFSEEKNQVIVITTASALLMSLSFLGISQKTDEHWYPLAMLLFL